MSGPSHVVLSGHARNKARQAGTSLTDVAETVLANHSRRRRNPGEADWRVVARGLVFVYNWPDGEDATQARVVSLWPKR